MTIDPNDLFVAGDTAQCAHCGERIVWRDSVFGGWWAHFYTNRDVCCRHVKGKLVAIFPITYAEELEHEDDDEV